MEFSTFSTLLFNLMWLLLLLPASLWFLDGDPSPLCLLEDEKETEDALLLPVSAESFKVDVEELDAAALQEFDNDDEAEERELLMKLNDAAGNPPPEVKVLLKPDEAKLEPAAPLSALSKELIEL